MLTEFYKSASLQVQELIHLLDGAKVAVYEDWRNLAIQVLFSLFYTAIRQSNKTALQKNQRIIKAIIHCFFTFMGAIVNSLKNIKFF